MPAHEILSRFDRRVKRAENLTSEGQKLYRKAELKLSTLDSLFHAAFLSMHAHFEIFLEDLFYSAVTGNSGIPECTPTVTFENRDQASKILFNNQDYVDWMPYPRGVLKISKLAFGAENPFDRLRRQERENQVLVEFSLLRNAIAHESRHSIRKIEYLTSTMKPRRKNIAGYLQHMTSGNSQFSAYATDIRIIATALAAPSMSAAKSRLSLEMPHAKGEKPGPGQFECATCGISRTLRSASQQIGKCKVCNNRNVRQIGWRRKYS